MLPAWKQSDVCFESVPVECCCADGRRVDVLQLWWLWGIAAACSLLRADVAHFVLTVVEMKLIDEE